MDAFLNHLPCLAAASAILVGLGCAPRAADVAAGTSAAYDVVVYSDALTGCDYVSTGTTHALTPRMGADGKQICAKVKP